MKKVFILSLILGLSIFASFGECAPLKTVPIGMAVEFMDHAACAYISQDKG
jgi:NitT/TauT family transport system substrate-binding protein